MNVIELVVLVAFGAALLLMHFSYQRSMRKNRCGRCGRGYVSGERGARVCSHCGILWE
jgi:hypothetical protein